jgi:putative transposase
MPRPLRIEYEGARYHVMSRGDRREAIFLDDADRNEFLRTLGQACTKTAWQVHAYCLMSNHFHLVVETPRPNLALGMKWFLGTYTQRFNRRHKHWGHLFGVDTKRNRSTGGATITCGGRATTCISIQCELALTPYDLRNL